MSDKPSSPGPVERLVVYIVCTGWKYEGYNIFDVFIDEDSANRCRIELLQKGSYDFVIIDERHIGLPNAKDQRADAAKESK